MSLPNPFAPHKPEPAPRPFPAPTTKAPATALRVVRAADAKADAIAFYLHGHGNGETTHMTYQDEHWTWLKKEITIITGYPNHGKSWWVLALMLVKAALKGWKFALYVPENEGDVFVGLAQMLVGRTANPKAGNARMSQQQLEAAMDWLNDYFVMVTAPDGCTPKQLLAEFAALHADFPLDGILIDPWNQLSHDFQSREDLYLSEQFSALKRFAIQQNLAVLVTAHPAGAVMDKNHKLLCPTAYSISGGKMWNNKFDNVLAVFRPSFPEPEVELWIHKIKKQGRVGKPGMLSLTYDRDRFRYECQTSAETHPLEKVSFNAPGQPTPEWNAQQLPPSQFDVKPLEKAPF